MTRVSGGLLMLLAAAALLSRFESPVPPSGPPSTAHDAEYLVATARLQRVIHAHVNSTVLPDGAPRAEYERCADLILRRMGFPADRPFTPEECARRVADANEIAAHEEARMAFLRAPAA